MLCERRKMVAVYILLGCYLAAAAVSDVRHRSVSMGMLAFGLIPAIAGLVANAISGDGNLTETVKCFCGIIPGAIVALTSYITRGGIGLGDAAVVAVIGCAVGLRVTVLVLGAAFLLVCIVSGVLLILGKLTRNSRLPFIPFLTAGFAAGMVIISI